MIQKGAAIKVEPIELGLHVKRIWISEESREKHQYIEDEYAFSLWDHVAARESQYKLKV